MNTYDFSVLTIDGEPIKRYAPADKPESIEPDIEAALY